MNNCGQVISLDLLIAMILVIFSIGIMLGAAETKMYELHEQAELNNLQEKTHAGIIVLSGGSLIGCVTDEGSVLPFTFDPSKESEITKENLGLQSINARVTINGVSFIDENITQAKNIFSSSITLTECYDGINLDDLNTENKILVSLEAGR